MLQITLGPPAADVAPAGEHGEVSSILDQLIDVIMRPHRYEVREEGGALFIRPAVLEKTHNGSTGAKSARPYRLCVEATGTAQGMRVLAFPDLPGPLSRSQVAAEAS